MTELLDITKKRKKYKELDAALDRLTDLDLEDKNKKRKPGIEQHERTNC